MRGAGAEPFAGAACCGMGLGAGVPVVAGPAGSRAYCLGLAVAPGWAVGPAGRGTENADREDIEIMDWHGNANSLRKG